ncbi:Choline transport protein [Colletotrichum trifolii]|uniref:Choline transport protein n=1 Tax=Colletotrichum trifolii TaxID=5466 RepID=A0A4R8QYH2_COLTR|nr:Choline transport protein [Colletotrichum trifolii]
MMILVNGGPPGIIYGLLVAVFYYSLIDLSLSEVWINFCGWMFSLASLMQISSNVAVSMYAVYHLDNYHVGTFFVLVGGVVTIIVLAAMPARHASNHFVWASFNENNATGWPSEVAFLLGVLNGAFTIGTPDSVTHMAEELPQPRKDLPKAIMLQILFGFVFAFCFAVALSYAIADMTALQGGFNTFPLTNIYVQATTNTSGIRSLVAAFGLLFIMLGCTLTCCVGLTLTVSRTYWALARDNAVPLSRLFGKVDGKLSCPVWSTLFVCLGAIPLGSPTAFLALAGSFIILTSVSYAIPFTANMLSGRKYFPKGPFHLGKAGYPINAFAVLSIVVFDVLFCFRKPDPELIEMSGGY